MVYLDPEIQGVVFVMFLPLADIVPQFLVAGGGVVQFGGVPTCPAGHLAGKPPVTTIFVVLLNIFEPAVAVILMLSPDAFFFPVILAAPVKA